MSAFGFMLLMIGGLLIAAVLFLLLPNQRSQSKADTLAESQRSGMVYRDDDRYWYGGIFYNNPGDPSPLVPKRYGLGWTVNFGHPLGKVFLLALIGMVLLPLLLAILVPGFANFGCHPSSGCHLSP